MISMRFSCKECGLTDVLTSVQARLEDDDIIEWINKVVMVALINRHEFLSPHCRPKQLSDLKIPIEYDDLDVWIGKQTELILPEGQPSNLKLL